MILNLMEELNAHIEVFDNASLGTNLNKLREEILKAKKCESKFGRL